MTNLGIGQLGALALVAGFPVSLVPTMAAIAMAESSGDPKAQNPSGAVGLWQILPSANQDIISKYGDPKDPLSNAKMAKAVYDRQGLTAWSTYTSGAYRQYLNTGKATQYDSKASDAVKLIESFEGSDSAKESEVNSNVSQGSGLIGTITGPLDAIGSAFNDLTSPATWLRVALIVGGVLVVVVGIIFMIESDKSVQGITKVAALA